MTALRVYRGKEGLSRTLNTIDELIEGLQEKQRSYLTPTTPQQMLAMEEMRRSLATSISDLFIARDIITAHTDESFRRQAASQAKESYHDRGIQGSIDNRGWRPVTILLPGGLRLKMLTPYLCPSRKGRRGRPRGVGKRGKGGTGLYSVLEALGITESATPLTRSEVSRQTVLCSSYEEAQDQLNRSGLRLDRDTLARLATHTGEKALSLRNQALFQALEDPLPQESELSGQRLRISVDGGRARIRETNHQARKKKNGRRPFSLDWREPRVITVDVLDGKGRTDRRWRPIYEVSLGEADEVFVLLCGLLRLLGAAQAKEIVFVSDGAEWIWNRVEELFLLAELPRERVHLVLDYYHATEYIAKALKACKHLGQEERTRLQSQLSQRLLKANGPEEVVAELKEYARGRRAKKIKKALAYLEKHQAHMNYALLREQSLPIGSGVVESTVRRVVNLRFKNASMCWCEKRLEALMYLRAILKSGRWDEAMAGQLTGRHFLSPGSHSIMNKVA